MTRTKLPVTVAVSASIFLLAGYCSQQTEDSIAFCPERSATSTLIEDSTKTVIVLDPGHGAEGQACIDKRTGIRDRETANQPETNDVFSVALTVKSKLEKDGYAVLLTKNKANEVVYKRQRVDTIKQSNADLTVSIHYDMSHPFDSWGEIYPQQVSLYRENLDGKKIIFTNVSVAEKSQEYAKKIAKIREAYEGHSVTIKNNDFNNREGVAPGNIPLVSLWSERPLLYLEAGAKGGMNKSQQDIYAMSIVAGIEASISPSKLTAQ